MTDVIADKAPSAAVQRQSQFVLGMVVPLERDLQNSAVINAKRATFRKSDTLELGLHRGAYSDTKAGIAVGIVSKFVPSASFGVERSS